MFGFDRPICASSDLKELEYISALHQTCKSKIRIDGSINATDIASLLCSKYGIKISIDDVRNFILEGYSCRDEALDLIEVVSILIIPYLLETVQNKESDKNDDFNISMKKSADDAISEVLDMILTEVTGSPSPKELNLELLSKVFAHYGEYEISRNDDLLNEMVKLAGEWTLLDKNTFGQALTNDILLFLKTKEVRYILTKTLSNLYQYNMEPPDIETVNIEPKSFRTVFNYPAIDLTIDSYHSKYLVIFLWNGFLVNFFTYVYLWANDQIFLCPKQGSLCVMGSHILDWIIKVLAIIIVGMFYLSTTSLGNGSDSTKPFPLIIGIIAVVGFTYLLFVAAQHENVPVEKSKFFIMLAYVMTLILGSCALLCQLIILYKVLTNTLPQPSINRSAINVKVGKMVENALDIHRSNEVQGKTLGYCLLKFMKKSDTAKTENCGGLRWCINKIRNGELYNIEGIKIPTRVIAGNFSLLYVAMFTITFGIQLLQNVHQNYLDGYKQVFINRFGPICVPIIQAVARNIQNFGSKIGELPPLMNDSNYTCFPTSQNIVICSIQDSNDTVMKDSLLAFAYQVAASVFNYWYPAEKKMLTIPLIVATIISFLANFILMLIYIPSTIITIIRLRSGDLATLHNRDFEFIRRNQDRTNIIFGSIFWSALYSSLLVGYLIGFVCFLFLWQVTRSYVVGILYYGLAVGITYVMKLLLLILLRGRLYTGFYRKIPASANIVGLALEVGNIGIAAGIALFRAGILSLVTLLHIGRIDVPLISTQSVASKLGLDRYPSFYLKNILANEAHCHPYMELLGVMYLMKLHFGNQFATRAGSSWRLIFVTALMPWVMKYRVITTRNIDVDDEELNEK